MAARRGRPRPAGVELEKESWLSSVLLEWGSCGRIAYVDDEPVGFVTYAPPQFVPRATAFPTSPVSADAVVLMTGGCSRCTAAAGSPGCSCRAPPRTSPAAGCGRSRRSAPPTPPSGRSAPPGATRAAAWCRPTCCCRWGSRPCAPHRRTPRLRLDLRTALSWREDVEHALEKILGTVRVPGAGVRLTIRDTGDQAGGAQPRGGGPAADIAITSSIRSVPVVQSCCSVRNIRWTAASRPSATVSRNAGSASRRASSGLLR